MTGRIRIIKQKKKRILKKKRKGSENLKKTKKKKNSMVNKKAKIKFFFFFSKFSLTQRSQVSTVPNKHRSSATAVLTSETLSSSQRSLTALKYVVIGRPH